MVNNEEIQLLKKEIFNKVRKYYLLAHQKDEFIPGKSKINYAGRVYDENELINLVDSALEFWLTAGRYAERFEKSLSEFLGVKHCILTNSGSSANLLAISTLTSPKFEDKRLKPGDEVITTACGFPTTITPIIQNNLIPVFIDVDLGTYNIQADKIEDAITKKTKAIVIAHTLGNPAELEKIREIVKKYNLWFIEDNCDALGSKYKGGYTGTFGHISTCSFYPPHHMTMGEGGVVLTDSQLLRRIILSFRDWGRDCWCEPGQDNACGRRFDWQLGQLPYGYDHKYTYSHFGYNLKVTDMQAAIGCAQLEKLPLFIEMRKRNHRALYNGLKKFEDMLMLPIATKYSDPSWFGFMITVKENAGFTRDDIVKHLENNKIQTRMLFAGNIIKHPLFDEMRKTKKGYRAIGDLRNTDVVMNNGFWIGVYPGMDEKRLGYVLDIFDGFFAGR